MSTQHEQTTLCLRTVFPKLLAILMLTISWTAASRSLRLDMSSVSQSDWRLSASREKELSAEEKSENDQELWLLLAALLTEITERPELPGTLLAANQIIKSHRSAPFSTLRWHFIRVGGEFYLYFVLLPPFCSTLIRFCSGLDDGGAGREPSENRKCSSSMVYWQMWEHKHCPQLAIRNLTA